MAFVPTDLAWVRVRSSNVAAYAYQPDFWRLWVEFRSGWVYRYDGVPPAVANALAVVPSPGQYVAYVLKGKAGGNYGYARVR